MTETKKSAPTTPPEWADDVQVGGSGEKKHSDRRDCWCSPKVVGLPHIAKGESEARDRVQVLHR